MRNLFVCLSIAFCFFFLSCKQEEKVNKKEFYEGPLSELYGINMTYSDSAGTVVRMSTEVQLTMPNEDKIYPKEVRVFFFDREGNNTTILRGDSARFIVHGKRGVLSTNGLEEQYTKIVLGFSLGDFNWFRKPKID